MIEMIKFAKRQGKDLYALGRNGISQSCGIELLTFGDTVRLSPINSKGQVTRCFIDIDKNSVPELIDILKKIK
jgi:hypothetical protein